MPTNLDPALARKRQSEDEAKFAQTLMLRCFAICLINILMVFESPLYAAAVICSVR